MNKKDQALQIVIHIMTYFGKDKYGKFNEMEFIPHEDNPDIINNKLNMVNRFRNWILWSSQNPQVISLTVKGFVPFLVLLGIQENEVVAFSDNISQAILAISMLVSALVGLWGFARKLYNTFLVK